MIRQAVLRALEHARHTAPRTGIILVGGLAAPLADGAPGDLDPTFGDAGRLVLEGHGPVWSLDTDDDGGGFLAGGDYYCDYWGACSAFSFIQSFSNAGLPDPDYTHADLSDVLILDTARQPDGKIVGVGRTLSEPTRSSLAVFRLMPDGTRDATLGGNGVVVFTSDFPSQPHGANSVVLEPDGRIVVSGWRSSDLLVMRLLADGTKDPSFGTDGLVVRTEVPNAVRLVRTSDGGYRINTQTESLMTPGRCRIVALTADGTPDQGFGTGGSVDAMPDATDRSLCNDLAVQPDGRLLIAGAAIGGANPGGLLVRLLPDGTRDDSFSAPAVGEAMSQATALAIGSGGDVFVAGQGDPDMAGAVITRVKSDGLLDTTFGNDGRTWIDPASPWAQVPSVHDMVAAANGSLTVSGSGAGAAFAARLSGDASADAPGVIGMTHWRTATNESLGQAVVTVRRTGGKAGAVSVAYRTAPLEGSGGSDGDASAGSDYQEVSGQLTWDDGDMTEREIVIPITADGNTTEFPETFRLEIDSLEGDAAFGGQGTLVEIAADGAPAGQILMPSPVYSVTEGTTLQVWVDRMFYGAGQVSVTLTASGGTAAGEDFELQSNVLTWADGEVGSKFVEITASRDSAAERPFEELTLTLSDPTGGAILGARTSSTVQIVDPPPQQAGGGGSGGGGSFGWASLLALGAAGLRRLRKGV